MKSFILSKTFVITYVIVLAIFGLQLMRPAKFINFLVLFVGSFFIAAGISFIINAFRKKTS
ncbi:hypothetical protein DXF96_09660 [Heyndrickxia coagulans]|uniref:Uncharacterized protein n=1 Tax=Heyndrickxia coagulans 36D1 TaxID=345219 RepID=G2TQD1_HEYCO|nr:hypothetical protein Bcoa_0556 [Heyndrickxia coagulans 36D1]AVD55348.1 hypothetical protein C3766_04000 [Heyndrickxia coagulans]AWP36216.1 hypothetical protein CYJ15_04105 [Heyndrickxia coagulans]KGT37454.1 hypothetical protein P421_15180 [Heyndrickxia coagulans P38]QDI61719.1 hypothetical protein DXF96_09660 [Heyndrickxia coagulans]